MPTPTQVATRLRHIRLQQNLTLKEVESRSRGRWKAVVVGSYERGTRSLSIHRAQEICDFYGVPLAQLFKEDVKDSINSNERGLIIDLRKLKVATKTSDAFTEQIYQTLQWISIQRDDWNGEVLSIRRADREILMLITRKTAVELQDALENRNLLLKN